MDKWAQYAKQTYRIERQYAPLFEKAIIAYRRQLIADMRANGIEQAHRNLNSGLPQSDLGGIIYKLYLKAGLIGARRVYKEVTDTARQQRGTAARKHYLKLVARNKAPELLLEQKAGFGLNEVWIQQIKDYLGIHLFRFLSFIHETMRADALKAFEKAFENGWGIDQLTDRLQDLGLVRVQARRIARTENNRGANVGHSIGAQSLPYEVNKKWVSARDHRTRDSHVLMNGKAVDELATFEVPVIRNGKPTGKTDLMQFPGDPSASADNTVNCRCRVIYEPKTDARGETIMREVTTPARIVPMNSAPSVDLGNIAAALRKAIKIGVD